MIWSVPEIIAQLSRQVRLAAGDVIFTGTPEGVGPVVRGDRLEAEIEGLEPLGRHDCVNGPPGLNCPLPRGAPSELRSQSRESL